MTQIHAIASAGSTARMRRSVTISGRRFDLAVWEEPNGDAWHWSITAPGVLGLSGAAASERDALASATRAGRTLARLVAA